MIFSMYKTRRVEECNRSRNGGFPKNKSILVTWLILSLALLLYGVNQVDFSK